MRIMSCFRGRCRPEDYWPTSPAEVERLVQEFIYECEDRLLAVGVIFLAVSRRCDNLTRASQNCLRPFERAQGGGPYHRWFRLPSAHNPEPQGGNMIAELTGFLALVLILAGLGNAIWAVSVMIARVGEADDRLTGRLIAGLFMVATGVTLRGCR